MRMVCDGTSGKFIMLHKSAENKSCDCAIFGKKFVASDLFLSKYALKILIGILLKRVVTKTTTIIRMEL